MSQRFLRKLIQKLATEGGCIVSSADCTESELTDARLRDDFYADDSGLGFVRRLPEWLQKHDKYCRGTTVPTRVSEIPKPEVE